MSEPELSASHAVEFVGTVPELLWSFAYVSRPTVRFGDADLRQLHLAAQAWNRRHNLTGRLVVVEADGEPARFVQCVEGPRPDIAACSRRIFGDARHGDIKVIQSTQIEARRFAGWSMQFETVAEASVGAEVAVALWGADARRVAHLGESIEPVDSNLPAAG